MAEEVANELVSNLASTVMEEGAKFIPGGGMALKAISVFTGGKKGGGGAAASKDKSSKALKKLMDCEVKNLREQMKIGKELEETKNKVTNIQKALTDTKGTLEKQISQNCQNLGQQTQHLAEETFSTIENLESTFTESLEHKTQKLQSDLNIRTETLTRSFESQIKEKGKQLEENLNKVKKAGAEALINKTKEINNKVAEVQKNFNQNLKNVQEDSNRKNKELYQTLSHDLADVSKNCKQLESMFKEELKESQKQMTNFKKENEKLFADIKAQVQLMAEKTAENKAFFADLASNVNNLTTQINSVQKSLNANNKKIEKWEQKQENMVTEFQEKLERALEKELEAYQNGLENMKKKATEVQKNTNKDIMKISKEAHQNAAHLNDVKNNDLPKLYDDIYKVQKKISDESNIKKLTQNRVESRIVELERKLETMNEKYLALLEDNNSIRNELHELSMQQVTPPTNFTTNFYRRRHDSEDDYSEIDEANEEFLNSKAD